MPLFCSSYLCESYKEKKNTTLILLAQEILYSRDIILYVLFLVHECVIFIRKQYYCVRRRRGVSHHCVALFVVVLRNPCCFDAVPVDIRRRAEDRRKRRENQRRSRILGHLFGTIRLGCRRFNHGCRHQSRRFHFDFRGISRSGLFFSGATFRARLMPVRVYITFFCFSCRRQTLTSKNTPTFPNGSKRPRAPWWDTKSAIKRESTDSKP